VILDCSRRGKPTDTVAIAAHARPGLSLFVSAEAGVSETSMSPRDAGCARPGIVSEPASNDGRVAHDVKRSTSKQPEDFMKTS
jgi:hypothetical protein